ncbi:unnamed protein product, partial [Mesorhabditis belari]|uniref:ABC-type antigen peptide transporter n=1 Tax=Mesorhabditis belari TaxID=2138241 RepID=A0AAF3FE70_9BILA
MRSGVVVPVTISLTILDAVLSILPLGYYHKEWSFDGDLVYKYLFFLDGYSFLSDPIDFVILSLIRIFLLIAGLLLVLLKRNDWVRGLFKLILGLAIASYSYVLIKLLALSENVEILTWPGIWFSVSLTILCSIVFALAWYFILAANHLPYERLIELTEATPATPATATDAETTSTDTEKRIPTSAHIKRLLKYCGNEWAWFSGGFGFLIVYSTARVFIPLYTGQVISTIVQIKSLSELLTSIFIMSGLTLVSTIFGGLRGGCFDYASARVNRQIRLDLFRSLAHQDIAFFDITKSGEMISRLTSDCQTMASTVAVNLNVFLRNGVMLLGALVFMFALSWRLSMVTFIAIPLVAFITKLYGSYYDKLSERTQETIAKANQMAEEVLSTMRTVRSFACEDREVKRFENHVSETLGVNKKKALAYMGYTWTNEFCDNAILVGVLFYGGHLVLTGHLSTDNLIKFLMYQMQLGENLYSIGYVMTGLMESVGASRKVFEYMNRKPAIPFEGKQRPKVTGDLLLEGVSFTYPSRPNNPVLKNFDLHIHPGETVALVGPSGGGKSSVVSLIQHFYEPNEGRILLDGIPVKDINHWWYHQRIALVAQEPILYDGSIRYNILYGCDWATEEDMLNAAKTANVHNFVQKLEGGYETNCGEKGVQMSGGQKQRIAIARALVRNPAVLILDEATSALDAESEALVQEALNRCAKERTVLIIAHRLSTIEKADRICVLEGGALVQTGNHRDLMKDKEGLYAALVKRQLLAINQSPSGSFVESRGEFSKRVEDEEKLIEIDRIAE